MSIFLIWSRLLYRCLLETYHLWGMKVFSSIFDFLLIALSIMENRALSSTIAIVEIFISHYDCICLFPYILIFIIKYILHIYVYNI